MTTLPDDDMTLAAVELVGRAGADQLQIGYLDDHPAATRWYAHAQYRGARITAEGQPGPGEAVQTLATRLLHGGRCMGCQRLVATSDDPVRIPARTLDGGTIDPDVEKARGLCRWNRVGPHWVPGCGVRAPDGSSREKLAQALVEANAPSGMIAAAREGRWDDYLSPHPLPPLLLVEDLRANGLDHLIERVMNGDFDGTQAESDAWAKSEDGQAAFAELTKPRQPWRANTRKGRRKTP